MAKSKKAKKGKAPDPWGAIPSENRPTPQRMRHGQIEPIDWTEKGVGRSKGKVALDRHATPIMRAHDRGKITGRQKDAADRFASLFMAARVVGNRRDSLDFAPRGSNNMSDEQAARDVDVWRECKAVELAAGSRALPVVKDIVIYEKPIGECRAKYRRFNLLSEGLDRMADYWKMPLEKTL